MAPSGTTFPYSQEKRDKIDSFKKIYIDHIMDEESFMKKATFGLKKVIIPKKCFLSKEWILTGQDAYFGMYKISGPGSPVYFRHWISREAFLMHRLAQ